MHNKNLKDLLNWGYRLSVLGLDLVELNTTQFERSATKFHYEDGSVRKVIHNGEMFLCAGDSDSEDDDFFVIPLDELTVEVDRTAYDPIVGLHHFIKGMFEDDGNKYSTEIVLV